MKKHNVIVLFVILSFTIILFYSYDSSETKITATNKFIKYCLNNEFKLAVTLVTPEKQKTVFNPSMLEIMWKNEIDENGGFTKTSDQWEDKFTDGEGFSHDAVFTKIICTKGNFTFVTTFKKDVVINGIAWISSSGKTFAISVSD